MKCPVCQAKLLPVDGEMFCLQCGHTLASKPEVGDLGPLVEETVDPLLQKAITDAVKHPINFRLPVSGAPPTKSTDSFNSMRSALAPVRQVASKISSPATVDKPVTIAATEPVISNEIVHGGRAPFFSKIVESLHREAKTPGTESAKPKHSFHFMRFVVAAPQVVSAGGGHIPIQVAVPLSRHVDAAEAGKTAETAIQPRSKTFINWNTLPIAWVIGLLVFGVFLLANGAIQYYYSNRVFPGVRVGTLALGGTPLDQVQSHLAASVSRPSLAARNGTVRYDLDTNSLAIADLNEADVQAGDAGHSTPLPIAGLLETLFSKPITMQWQVSATQANSLAKHLASVVDTSASSAAPIIIGGQAFVISEKTGSQLNVQSVADEIRGAYGHQSTIILNPVKLEPATLANSYNNDVESAQSAIALTLHMTLNGVVYAPTPAQIGNWLVFNGPGKGVAVDGSQVATYISSIPGNFDRIAATNSLLAAIEGRQNINYNISTSKTTSTPKLTRLSAALPVATYSYCTQAATTTDSKLLAAAASSVLADDSGWSLGGKVKFVPVTSGCNFALQLVQESAMAGISSACTGLSTCQVGAVLAISDDKWMRVPSSWTGTLAGYRTGMIDQNVGEWLGFEHASCTTKTVAQPILEAPTVVLDGCSPNWYQIPLSTSSSKVPASF